VNSCFTIHSEKPTAKIAVPMEEISAMKDMFYPSLKVEHTNKNNGGNPSTNAVSRKGFVNRESCLAGSGASIGLRVCFDCGRSGRNRPGSREDYSLLNNCMTIQMEKPTEKIATPTEEISAMNDIMFTFP
jgi:hypothetical protein